jgi:hypothetical protein
LDEFVSGIYRFMLIDEATSFRVLRISDHNNTKTAMDLLNEVREHFLSAMPEIQTDNDSSFVSQFAWHHANPRSSHRHIPTKIGRTSL